MTANRPPGKVRPLTAKQAAFLDLLISSDLSASQAYERVYGCSPKAARSGAARTLALPQVAAECRRRAARVLGAGSLIAAMRLVSLAQGAESEYVQADAARAVLDRAGLSPRAAEVPRQRSGIVINIDLSAPDSGGRSGKAVPVSRAAETDGAGRDLRAR